MGLCVLLAGYRLAFAVALLVSVARRRVGVAARPRPAPASSGSTSTCSARRCSARGSPGRCSPSRAARVGVDVAGVLGLASGGVVLLVLWVLRSLRVPAPLVDLRLACARGVLGVNLAAVLLGVCVFGGAAAVILLVQRPPSDGVGFGYSVFVTGLLMTPMAVASLLSPPMARAIARRLGERVVLPLGSFVAAAAFGTFALLHDRTWHIVLTMALMGVGIGISYSVMPMLIVARTPRGAHGQRHGGQPGAAAARRQRGCRVRRRRPGRAHAGGASSPAESGYVVGVLVVAAAGLLSAISGWVLVPPVRQVRRGEAPEPFVVE